MPLPPAETALDDPNGLLAAGRDLSADRILEAYRGGIFPWFSDGQPVLWWSPDPRMVLFLDEFRLTRSLRKTMAAARRDDRWRVTHDRAFTAVMRACAAPRDGQSGTWITDGMVAAYTSLHRRGHAHSVEVWRRAGETGPPGTALQARGMPGSATGEWELAGGLYGVSIGRMFFGESMFARERDASKTALAVLVAALRDAGFRVIDCQQDTRHLASLGAREIPRDAFLALVDGLAARPDADWPSLAIDLPGDR